jgi:hypothetical protein
MRLVSELLTECSVRLGDSSNLIWSSAELLRYVKDGLGNFCRDTLCIWKQAYLNDQDGQSEAEFPSDYLIADRATWGGRPLDIVAESAVAPVDHLYQSREGRVFGLIMSGTRYARKWRVPSTSITSTNPDDHAPTTDSVDNTRLEYFAQHPTITASSVIDLPRSYAKTIRHYVLWKAYERNGPGQSPKLAIHYMQRWVAGVMRAKEIRSSLCAAMPSTLSGGERTRRRIARPIMPPEYGRIVRR